MPRTESTHLVDVSDLADAPELVASLVSLIGTIRSCRKRTSEDGRKLSDAERVELKAARIRLEAALAAVLD